jgi:DNA-binding winged helix-turn-helix (wHTH) protein/tetratricopeptide (TPR) repeat protein
MGTNLVGFSVFTFDPASGELKRNGRSLRVPPQTILLLTILLERAGTIVTRDELRQLLWPNGEFIDHEHAINRAINYLRMVLRDTAKKPQFIETLPKRGYRFIAEITLPLPAEPTAAISDAPPLKDATIAALRTLIPETPAPAPNPEPTRTATVIDIPSTLLPQPVLLPRLRGERWDSQWQWLVAACLILGAGLVIILARPHPANARPVISVGIVPFDTPNTRSEQLGESLRMDLTDALSQLPSVQLRASHSFANLKRDDAALRDTARALHLDALLLGKFSLDGDRCALQLELVRGSDAVHMASFRYTGTVSELATIRDKVQKDIFASLQLGGQSIQAGGGSTQNPLAYSAYLQARDLASRRTVASLNGAIAQYIDSTERDPSFARAYAGMATAYMSLGSLTDPIVHLHEAQLFAQKALQLDPRLAEPHAVLGFVALRKDWNASVGENELRRAVDLEPNEAAYHGWLAEALADEGHFQDALHHVDIAHTEDPLWPEIDAIDVFVSGAARQNARAVDAAVRVVKLVPYSSFAHDQLGWTLFDAGRFEEAIAEWHTMAIMEKDPARADLEDRGLAAYRHGGASAYAALKLDAIANHPDATASHPNDFAPEEWYAYVGDRDHAITALQQTIDRHDPSAIDLGVNPMLDNLHHDPRFVALLNRVGVTLPLSAEPTLRASLRD